ncbi:MAG TPA: 16S rRNA (adenine(1518)-N(6)/adenine(1519)-N(6))-dimethyltransferase RsmA [Lautropia sp.]|jgi:16S rRNA (adenine1518-N6/adenine1519-N6)-dimethyltransferase|nr:16S rRNA (adenine(1518)-N(6)/adenine(1519)-N(6))-dimethyltransferase RsmA [Lautropia sp.]
MTAEPQAGRVVARRRFGQHFLVDRAAIEAIVEAIAPRPGQRLVEIGPGTGALTGPLLSRLGSMDAIEIDRDLAAILRRRWGERLRLHQQDVLQFDFASLAQRDPTTGEGHALRLAGNLPYNISSPLLLHLMRFTGCVIDQHFMLQKEVVDRIIAEPGGDMGRLTVLLQAWYEVQTLMNVPPEAFDPPPKVESSVIRMVPRPAPLTHQTACLQSLLAAGFSQRRKMIRNTLGKWLQSHHPGLDLAAASEREPLLQPFTESTRRAEEIPVASWCALADRLGPAPVLAAVAPPE